MSRKLSFASPTSSMSDGIRMGASSTFDRLMTSMSKQKSGASSSTRLQPQLTSSSLGLTPSFGATVDMFAGVMNGLDELRRDMTKRVVQTDERAHRGRENLSTNSQLLSSLSSKILLLSFTLLKFFVCVKVSHREIATSAGAFALTNRLLRSSTSLSFFYFLLLH